MEKVIYAGICAETGERVRQANILTSECINIGRSDAGEENIINKGSAVRNSVDKARMLRLFRHNGVKSLTFIDNKSILGKVFLAYDYYINKNVWVDRSRGLRVLTTDKDVMRTLRRRQGYCTRREECALEYRVLVFRGTIFRVFWKKGTAFIKKNRNCEFIDVNIDLLNEDIKRESIKAVAAVGLDLAGVDIMLTTDFKVKVIEVNSGASLGWGSIKRLRKLIEKHCDECGKAQMCAGMCQDCEVMRAFRLAGVLYDDAQSVAV